MRTTGPVVFLDSLLMVHPWQRAVGLFGFGGVDLNMILECLVTTLVQRKMGLVVFLDSWQLAEGIFQTSGASMAAW